MFTTIVKWPHPIYFINFSLYFISDSLNYFQFIKYRITLKSMVMVDILIQIDESIKNSNII
jgi:hypothetical protein